jgi:predicted flap endonuclease-1-like 5' DNA nuclease
MQHRASLVSYDTDEEVAVVLDLVADHVEILVEGSSVGRWPVEAFVAAPDAARGFQLNVDGELWSVKPRDQPLFVADALPRIRWLSRARLINRYPRATRLISQLVDPTGRRRMTWYGAVIAISIGSFGFGAIVGRYRVDGDNVWTWALIALLASTSAVVARVVIRGATEQGASRREGTPDPTESERVPAVSRLMSTLQFREPTAAPTMESPAAEHADDIEADTEESTADKDAAEIDGSPPPQFPDETPHIMPVDMDSIIDPDDREPAPPEEQLVIALGSGEPPAADTPADNNRIVVISIDEEDDDLTTIHGIGPTYAGILNDLGIRTYRQLAKIDGATLADVRSRIGALAGRIDREHWIEHAAEAHRAKRARPRTEVASE